MCWSTFKTANKLIAEENIPIFKVCVKASRLSDGTAVYSYFKYYRYKFNTVYKLTDKIVTYNVIASTGAIHTCIDAGYHSYLTSKCSFVKDFTGRASVIDNKGLRYFYGEHALKASGYIPKGSEYYVNEQGECVSNSICLTKVEGW